MKTHLVWTVLRPDLARLSVLCALAVAVGLSLNQLRQDPLPLRHQSKIIRLEHAVLTVARPTALEVPSGRRITPPNTPTVLSLEQFQQYSTNHEGVILDARAAGFYRLGHVPGAFNLPRENFAATWIKLKEQIPVSPNQPLAVYCSDTDCEDSQLVADALVQLGYQRVSRFPGGWAQWTAAHLPEEVSR